MTNENNALPKPYIRKRTVVYAMQFSFAGEIETGTGTGIFKHKPGDWLMKSASKMWVCEGDEFENLYEPMTDTLGRYNP